MCGHLSPQAGSRAWFLLPASGGAVLWFLLPASGEKEGPQDPDEGALTKRLLRPAASTEPEHRGQSPLSQMESYSNPLANPSTATAPSAHDSPSLVRCSQPHLRHGLTRKALSPDAGAVGRIQKFTPRS